jgi:hypothetical protein
MKIREIRSDRRAHGEDENSRGTIFRPPKCRFSSSRPNTGTCWLTAALDQHHDLKEFYSAHPHRVTKIDEKDGTRASGIPKSKRG